eukprot:scaffold75073_cov60-Phaeocystis_antarctica.AAC.3
MPAARHSVPPSARATATCQRPSGESTSTRHVPPTQPKLRPSAASLRRSSSSAAAWSRVASATRAPVPSARAAASAVRESPQLRMWQVPSSHTSAALAQQPSCTPRAAPLRVVTAHRARAPHAPRRVASPPRVCSPPGRGGRRRRRRGSTCAAARLRWRRVRRRSAAPASTTSSRAAEATAPPAAASSSSSSSSFVAGGSSHPSSGHARSKPRLSGRCLPPLLSSAVTSTRLARRTGCSATLTRTSPSASAPLSAAA